MRTLGKLLGRRLVTLRMAAVDSYRKYIYLSNNNYVESGFGHVLESLKFDFSVRVLLIVLEFTVTQCSHNELS